MTASLEWPTHARITAEGRRQVEAEHRQRLASYHQQPRAAPPAASASQIAALAKRVAEMERRLLKAEKAIADRPKTAHVADAIGKLWADIDRSTLSYGGTWDATKPYRRGTLVTDRGAGWIATSDAEPGERPGRCGRWKLAIKGAKP